MRDTETRHMEGSTTPVTNDLFMGPLVGGTDDTVLIAFILLFFMIVIRNGR